MAFLPASFEKLNGTFVFFRCTLAVERAEIFSFTRSRIFLARIQPILPGLQFPNHNDSLGAVDYPQLALVAPLNIRSALQISAG